MYSLKRHTLETIVDTAGVALWFSWLVRDIGAGKAGWAAVDGAALALFVCFVIGDIIRGSYPGKVKVRP